MDDETALNCATTFIEASFSRNIGIADNCVDKLAEIAELTYLQSLSLIICAAAMTNFSPKKELAIIEAANYLAKRHVNKEIKNDRS
ncbi:hypothetical protein [Lactobacillus crispatus]|uniref:hypothetical protein n=1 Tax=Lactobacillus crispatus TaxID=47770 RepID=UPI00103DC370|nr:hypothetical protein [Lactobacillus crispatus]